MVRKYKIQKHKITKRYHLTVPKTLMELYGKKEGSRVIWRKHDDKDVDAFVLTFVD